MPRFTGGAVGALAYDAISTFEPSVPLPGRGPGRRARRPRSSRPTSSSCSTTSPTRCRRSPRSTPMPPTSRAATGSPSAAIFEALERTARPTAAELAGGGRRDRDGADGGRPRPRARSTTSASAATSTSTRSSSRRTRSRPARRSRSCWPAASRSTSRPTADGEPARRHRPVPRAAPGQPEPVPVLRPDARVRGRRRQPGAPAPGRGRPADDPPDRRHPAARRDAGRGRRCSPTSSSGDPKERAEHVMLVDLGRNDLGRVARPGTVTVEQVHGGRALQPRAPPREPRRGAGSGRSSTRSTRCASVFPAGTLTRRAQDPRDAADRRRRGRAARPVWWRRGLPRLRRQPRHGDHDPERRPQGRPGARPHGRRDRRRQRARERSSRRPSTRRRRSGGRSSSRPAPPATPRRRRPRADAAAPEPEPEGAAR